MNWLRTHARWLCCLALLQVVGGPAALLVIGLAWQGALPVENLPGQEKLAEAEQPLIAAKETGWAKVVIAVMDRISLLENQLASQDASQRQPATDEREPTPNKGKSSKGKGFDTLVCSLITPLIVRAESKELAPMGEQAVVVSMWPNAPPGPPPRWV